MLRAPASKVRRVTQYILADNEYQAEINAEIKRQQEEQQRELERKRH